MTRRCTQGEFLLRPSPTTNGIFLYVLAVAAQRSRIQVHVCCVLSNHVHLVVTDPQGRLPEFLQYLDGNVARAVNVALGRSQSLWDDRGCSVVALTTRAAIVDSAAYVLANPVAARLVREGREWPGVWTDPERIGGAPIVFERPAGFFRKNGPTPERAVLQLTPPPGFTPEEFRDEVTAALAAREQEARAAVQARGKGFMGARRVLAQKTSTLRASRPQPRGGLRPTVATRDRAQRREELARIRAFVDRYREARARYLNGERDVIFPSGTYWLRVCCGVACAAIA